MATVAFFAPAAAGHVNPTLGLAAELVRRGHRVTYATTGTYAERVAEIVPVTSTWEGRDDVETPQMHGRELVRAMGLWAGRAPGAWRLSCGATVPRCGW